MHLDADFVIVRLPTSVSVVLFLLDWLSKLLLYVLFRVKKSLSETKPDDVDLFTKNVQTFVKDVLANFKEYQFFCGRYITSHLVNMEENQYL